MKLFTMLTFTNEGQEPWRNGRIHRWGVYEEDMAYSQATRLSSHEVCEESYLCRDAQYVIVHEVKIGESFPPVWFENQDFLHQCYWKHDGEQQVTNGSPQNVINKLVHDLHHLKYFTKVFFDVDEVCKN